jgi:sigma-E factor negative regulatory protein RseC
MLTEVGRIVAIEDGAVWVETLRQTSCGSCSARAGCGHGMLNSALPGASQGLLKAALPTDRGLPLKLHDQVTVELPESGFVRAASLLYLLPLLSTVLLAVLADQLMTPASLSQAAADLRVSLAAVAGLILGLQVLRVLSRRSECRADMQPRVSEIV